MFVITLSYLIKMPLCSSMFLSIFVIKKNGSRVGFSDSRANGILNQFSSLDEIYYMFCCFSDFPFCCLISQFNQTLDVGSILQVHCDFECLFHLVAAYSEAQSVWRVLFFFWGCNNSSSICVCVQILSCLERRVVMRRGQVTTSALAVSMWTHWPGLSEWQIFLCQASDCASDQCALCVQGSGPLPWERGSGTSWPGETADRSKAASWRRAQRPGPGQAAPRRPRGSGLDECRRSSLSSKWRRLQQDIPPLPDEFEFSQALQIFVPGVMLL